MSAARYFITDNRRAPVVCVIGGRMHPRSGLWRSCNNGLLLLSRPLSKREAEAVEESGNTLWLRWTSVTDMLRDERDEFGMRFCRLLIDKLREHRYQVKALLRKAASKEAKHQRKLLARRAAC